MNIIDNHINYIEFHAPDLPLIKAFYTDVFGWEFTDYGDDYVAFSNSGIEGGFTEGDVTHSAGSPLVILHHHDLESMVKMIEDHGGSITKSIFSFPGGQRFHFRDPAGNELAVWRETTH